MKTCLIICRNIFIFQSKSVSTILHYYSQLWPRRIPKPPYNHVVQAGDPILRSPCPKVPIEDIRTIRTLKTIQQLKKTMRLYKCVGLAAPQIGINQRIFIMEFNQEHMASVQPVHIEKYAMSPIPMTVNIVYLKYLC